MNEKERGSKCLFSGLRDCPDIWLERLGKIMKMLSQDMCSY